MVTQRNITGKERERARHTRACATNPEDERVRGVEWLCSAKMVCEKLKKEEKNALSCSWSWYVLRISSSTESSRFPLDPIEKRCLANLALSMHVTSFAYCGQSSALYLGKEGERGGNILARCTSALRSHTHGCNKESAQACTVALQPIKVQRRAASLSLFISIRPRFPLSRIRAQKHY